MIRIALVLCAALTAATFAGTAQAQVCPAIANIGLVPASFDPTSSAGTPAAVGPAPGNIQADLLVAYNAAPLFFKNQLCNLDGIFVTQSRDSWGYRDINTGKRYIAISTSLWGPSGPATLDEYQNRVFGPPTPWPATDRSPPNYRGANPNSGTMMLIAALAHEFGHVLWPDILIFPRNTLPQSSRFCRKILTDHMEGSRKIPYWNGTLLQRGVWTSFKDVDQNPGDIPDDLDDAPPPGHPGPQQAKVVYMESALRNGDIPLAHRILRRILARGRPFPSLLGAYSANEQFVETFVLYTLLHVPGTPLRNLPLQVSPGVSDIPLDLSQGKRPRLAKVLECFDGLVP